MKWIRYYATKQYGKAIKFLKRREAGRNRVTGLTWRTPIFLMNIDTKDYLQEIPISKPDK
jgi:hypothetical protein